MLRQAAERPAGGKTEERDKDESVGKLVSGWEKTCPIITMVLHCSTATYPRPYSETFAPMRQAMGEVCGGWGEVV